jgi:hypothetical protein
MYSWVHVPVKRHRGYRYMYPVQKHRGEPDTTIPGTLLVKRLRGEPGHTDTRYRYRYMFSTGNSASRGRLGALDVGWDGVSRLPRCLFTGKTPSPGVFLPVRHGEPVQYSTRTRVPVQYCTSSCPAEPALNAGATRHAQPANFVHDAPSGGICCRLLVATVLEAHCCL